MEKELLSEIKEFFTGSHASHDWEHTERVTKLALKIGKEEAANLKIVEYASIMHDIGRSIQDKTKGKICHAEKGKEIAEEILRKRGYDEEFITNVTHCIETHRFRNDLTPKTTEAKVLYDADKLDSIGAVGIGRTFLFAGGVGAKFHNKEADIMNTKEYSEDDTAYREYMVKLRFVKDKMMTKTGRKIAEDRHSFMVGFFERLNKEVDGLI